VRPGARLKLSMSADALRRELTNLTNPRMGGATSEPITHDRAVERISSTFSAVDVTALDRIHQWNEAVDSHDEQNRIPERLSCPGQLDWFTGRPCCCVGCGVLCWSTDGVSSICYGCFHATQIHDRRTPRELIAPRPRRVDPSRLPHCSRCRKITVLDPCRNCGAPAEPAFRFTAPADRTPSAIRQDEAGRRPFG
jgi:hypothetical protein